MRAIRDAAFAVTCAALSGAAFAQTSPQQGTSAPAAREPTSLAPAAGFVMPRTPEGHPDLQGVVWEGAFFGFLEPVPLMLPPQVALDETKGKEAYDRMVKAFTSAPGMKELLEVDPEAAGFIVDGPGLPLVRGERRTRLVVLPADGKLPYTPEARREAQGAMAALMVQSADDPEQRGAVERCVSMGAVPPMAMMTAMHPRQFIQTADHLVIHSEYGDEARIIRMGGEHGVARTALGDAVARWEGDTLVIETTMFLARDRMRPAFPSGLIVGPDAKVIERYTRVSADELVYQFTVEDPSIYTAPWLAEYSIYRASFRMFPTSCHEGNYSLGNILRGARVAENRMAGR